MTDYSKDYYAVLGVRPSATAQEFRRAYLRLALLWHPDRHAGESRERVAYAEARFKEIGEAYAVLSDRETRSAYDYFHSVVTASSAGSPRPRPSGQPTYGPSRPARNSTWSGRSYDSSGASARTDSSFDRGRAWGAGSRTHTYEDTSQGSKWGSWKSGFRRFYYGILIPACVIFTSLSGLFCLVEWADDTFRYHAVQYQPSVNFWRTEDTVKMETFYERMMKMMDFPKVEAREIHLDFYGMEPEKTNGGIPDTGDPSLQD